VPESASVKPQEAKTAAPKEDVRVVPIYRKIEDRAPTEPEPETVIQKSPSAVAQKTDSPLPEPPPVVSAPAPVAASDAGTALCARYGLHKVITQGGKSWRCSR
jgi:hypothetical protein